jgi:hypothetical protein
LLPVCGNGKLQHRDTNSKVRSPPVCFPKAVTSKNTSRFVCLFALRSNSALLCIRMSAVHHGPSRRRVDPTAAMPSYYARDFDGASQTSLRTPSSNRSTFTSRIYSDAQTIPRGIPHPATVGQLPTLVPDRRANKSSATWTSSSGDLAGLSDSDEVQDRPEFVQEYNKLARKVSAKSLRPIVSAAKSSDT